MQNKSNKKFNVRWPSMEIANFYFNAKLYKAQHELFYIKASWCFFTYPNASLRFILTALLYHKVIAN